MGEEEENLFEGSTKNFVVILGQQVRREDVISVRI